MTSWTAPPVDWQGVPAHIHFYIKFLLLYFLTGIFYVLCFCNTLYKICIKRLKAMHSVSAQFLHLWWGGEIKKQTAVMCGGWLLEKDKKKTPTFFKCAKNQPHFCMSFGENPMWSVLFLRMSLGSMLSVLADCCTGGPNLHVHFSSHSSECIFNMYIYVQGPSVLTVM